MSTLETAKDQTGPRLIQLTVVLPNRVGALLGLVRTLEEKNIHVCAVSILDSADHAVIRLVVDRPDLAVDSLRKSGHDVFTTELLAVLGPGGKDSGPRKVLSSLLMAEVNIHYLYPLIVRCHNQPILALAVDDGHAAAQVLRKHGFQLIGQDELIWEEDMA